MNAISNQNGPGILVIMDPIDRINIRKDSTFAMLLEIQRRGWPLFYTEPRELATDNGVPGCRAHAIQVKDDPEHWFEMAEPSSHAAEDFDVILMRKDPPFDMSYIHATYWLSLAEASGTLVVNRPQALRDYNEKYAVSWFPHLTAPTLISSRAEAIRVFLDEHRRIVVKPLDGMGGEAIFQLRRGDANTNVVLETLLADGLPIMAQCYLDAIDEGDKRILLVNGEPVPYALARIPAEGEFRGNLARGGRGKGVPLSDRDTEIAMEVGELMRDRGVLFAGIDVIGDALTEINLTSPTCIRELDALYDLNIAGQLMDVIEEKLRP